MKKPTVYLDTSFLSAIEDRGNDSESLNMKLASKDWWRDERTCFDLYVSVVTIAELSDGFYSGKRACLRMAQSISRLQVTQEVLELGEVLMSEGVVPRAKKGDALQMAVCAVNTIDYLLTWNHSHLANVFAQRKLEEVLRRHQFRPPLMVTPVTIPQTRFGQDPRRR